PPAAANNRIAVLRLLVDRADQLPLAQRLAVAAAHLGGETFLPALPGLGHLLGIPWRRPQACLYRGAVQRPQPLAGVAGHGHRTPDPPRLGGPALDVPDPPLEGPDSHGRGPARPGAGPVSPRRPRPGRSARASPRAVPSATAPAG